MMKTGLVQRPKLVTGMVVAQFVISVVLVVMVLGIAQQMVTWDMSVRIVTGS